MPDPQTPWDTPAPWKPALEAARAGGSFLLLGAVDSGKSTLAAILANEAHRAGRTVAVVDADIGQSSIGPPACVGMARPTADIASLDDLPLAAMDFVGACSPAGHLLQCATSAAAMAHAARPGAETLIVDTTGLISGPFARALKNAKIRLLDPDFIIALQAEDELEDLIAHYRTRAKPHLLRLPISRAVKERSREERASRRQSRFASYFAGAGTIDLAWEDALVENSPWTSGDPAPGHLRAYAEECVACEVLHAECRSDGIFLIVSGRPDEMGLRTLGEGFGPACTAIESAALDRLLLGILGPQGETLGLGILEEVDFRHRRSAVFTPLKDPEAARGLRLGSIRLARDGTQLGTSHFGPGKQNGPTGTRHMERA